MKHVLAIYPTPDSHWVGNGFPVKTMFSYQTQGHIISPFLLLDHAGPMEFSASTQKRGVAEHPHRGFETVTLVYNGELSHRDSSGKHGIIGPGDVQWMTAGSGVLHEELHSEGFTKNGGVLDMLQLWVNLPKNCKMINPKYQGITADQIPKFDLPDNQGSLRVIAGEAMGLTGPANTHTPMLVMDGVVQASAKLHVPLVEGWTGVIVVFRGLVRVDDEHVFAGQTVILSREGNNFEIEALKDSQLLILSGEPIDDPIAGYGPFVMNSRAEIEQAFNDFENGKFGKLA